MSEVPDLTNSTYETETTITRSEEGQTQKTVTVTKRKPIGTVANYFHTKSEGAGFSIKTTSESFQVWYDEHGIVQDFGFASRPGLSVR
jgi:hypothetical protein